MRGALNGGAGGMRDRYSLTAFGALLTARRAARKGDGMREEVGRDAGNG